MCFFLNIHIFILTILFTYPLTYVFAMDTTFDLFSAISPSRETWSTKVRSRFGNTLPFWIIIWLTHYKCFKVAIFQFPRHSSFSVLFQIEKARGKIMPFLEVLYNQIIVRGSLTYCWIAYVIWILKVNDSCLVWLCYLDFNFIWWRWVACNLWFCDRTNWWAVWWSF